MQELVCVCARVVTVALALNASAQVDAEDDDPVPLLVFAGPSDTKDEDLALHLRREIDRFALGQFWGAVAVVKDGKALVSKGFGFANDRLVPITADSLFDIGSVAKQFTAAGILRLEVQGKLNTSDSITKHLQDVPGDKSAITIHQLLTHTSGLSPRMTFQGVNLDDRDATMKHILDSTPEAKPGERFEYNNVGYFILAAIIEQASGQPFEAYLRQQVFKPAGMKSTGFVDGEGLDRTMATARIGAGEPISARGDTFTHYWNWANRGATGVITSLNDLNAWDRALHGNDVLNDAAKEKFFAPEKSGYACGWFVEPTARGTTMQHHGGSTRGYRAQLTRFPNERSMIVVLSNNQHDTAALEHSLRAILFPDEAVTLTAALYLKPYTRDEHGVVRIENGAQWKVMPQYVSVNEAGERSVDHRLTLALVDEAAGFWPAIIRMSNPLARDLIAQLDHVIQSKGEKPAEKDDSGMHVMIGTRAYAPNKNMMIELPAETRVMIQPQYVGVDENGTQVVDDRICFVLIDHARGFWPLIVKMDVPTARRFLAEIKAIAP